MNEIDHTYIVRVTGLAHGGACIGDIITEDSPLFGKKVFLREVVPGEHVRARTVKEERSFLLSELVEVLEPSADRVAPPCRYYGKCGGCDLQNLSIERQRKAKVEMVASMLQYQAGVKPAEGIFLQGKELAAFGYRSRASFHIDKSGRIGFYERGSGRVVDLESCLLLEPRINAVFEQVREIVSSQASLFATLVLDEINDLVWMALDLRDGSSKDDIPELFLQQLSREGIHWSIRDSKLKTVLSQSGTAPPIGHFSQINKGGNEILVKIVNEKVTSGPVTELYAGSGNFAFPLAKRGISVQAVEVDAHLVSWGQEQARAIGLLNEVKFHSASCEEYLRHNPLTKTVLLDPPRSGAKGILKHFADQHIRQVLYVSCSIPTLCRDLKTLSSYGYSVDTVYVVDMFSQTHHVETVSVLKR